ncbi:hypothetical protein PInf_005435 [Phytophthora infestans]|nr:hypothetical protein PInf_005435 [Phytophthora infestans]
MAASSQGGDDDEERRALELELAAELAALSTQDVELEGSLDGDVDQNDGIGGCGSNEVMYVRLDLDSVLKQVTETGAQGLHSVDKEHQVSPSSWGLLLQSVARSDREFFQPCREILHEIRTYILDVESPISSDEPQTQRPNEEIKGRTATSDEKTDSPSLGSTIFYLEEAAVKENGNPTSLLDTVTKESAKTSTMTRDPGGCHPTPPLTASDGPNQVVALPDVPPLTIAEDNQSALTAEQKQLEAIAKQHEARESRRLKAQARHEKERAETAQLLSRLEEEYETQERIAARSQLPLVLEDFSDEEQPQAEENGDSNAAGAEVLMTAENQAAARRLQSTFRGFHVRRKFANALALAQVVEEGDPFDGVDLEDLIQLPPELVEGWEDPVLPRTPVLSHQRYPPISTRIDRVDHVENNEIEGQENDNNLERVKPESVPNPPKEQSLAATLWNKMKRVKQRQKHSQQERQRQLDPVCRVQKLLNRKPNNRNNSNQSGNSSNSRSRSQSSQGGQQATNMISWSSTTNAKKKPKVKLPSLVERLRRQTMAER